MIQELPFFELLILTLLPLTIGFILFFKVMKFIIGFYKTKKTDSSRTILEFGDFLLFMVFFVVIMQIVMYLTGDVPDDFSIFNYLIEDMLPITWYVILMYGILINLFLFFGGRNA